MIFNPVIYAPKPSYPANFSDATWEQIIEACQNKAVPDTWVADGSCYKDMLIGGTNYCIDIIGKNHDDYADGSGKAPLTFQMHDCYGTTYQMNNVDSNEGGWDICDMRRTHLPTILAMMPAEVQAAIKEVQKKSSASGQSSSIQTTNDKLFLLSEIEIFGNTTNSFAGQGTQYAYYQAGNSKVKNRSGGASSWWERSPASRTSTTFCFVHISGGARANSASLSLGVAFGFCF